MLTMCPAKREKGKLFSREMAYGIFDGEQQVGALTYDSRKLRGAFSCDGKGYVVERQSDRKDEVLYQAAFRLLTGRAKPPPNPYLLKDSDARVLASAEPVKARFEVTRGSESFLFHKASSLSRPYHLYRPGSDLPLGSVGQAKLLSRGLYMDLPAEFDRPFQVFLLVLVLDATMKALENSSSVT